MNDHDRVAAPTDAQDRGTPSPRPGAVFLLELGGDFRLLNANHQALGDFSHLTPPLPCQRGQTHDIWAKPAPASGATKNWGNQLLLQWPILVILFRAGKWTLVAKRKVCLPEISTPLSGELSTDGDLPRVPLHMRPATHSCAS